MTRVIPFALLGIFTAVGFMAIGILAANSLPQSEPEPCALPERMPAEIELHDGMSATEATLESVYGANLDGAPSHE